MKGVGGGGGSYSNSNIISNSGNSISISISGSSSSSNSPVLASNSRKILEDILEKVWALAENDIHVPLVSAGVGPGQVSAAARQHPVHQRGDLDIFGPPWVHRVEESDDNGPGHWRAQVLERPRQVRSCQQLDPKYSLIVEQSMLSKGLLRLMSALHVRRGVSASPAKKG